MRNRTYGGVRGRKTKVGGKKTASFSSYSISVPPAIMVQTQETTSYYFLISLLISFDSFVNFLAKLSLYAAISTIL